MYTPKNDLDGITNGEDRWPHWPLLPMKRRVASGDIHVGVIHAQSKTCVVLGNIYQPIRLEELSTEPTCFRYDSIEAMLADGWRVD